MGEGGRSRGWETEKARQVRGDERGKREGGPRGRACDRELGRAGSSCWDDGRRSMREGDRGQEEGVRKQTSEREKMAEGGREVLTM